MGSGSSIHPPKYFYYPDKLIPSKYLNVGFWCFSYNKCSNIHSKWVIVKEILDDNYNYNCIQIISAKCSNYYNDVSNSLNWKIIVYCNNSENKEKIMTTGNRLIYRLKYTETPYIIYTSSSSIDEYKLQNDLYGIYKKPAVFLSKIVEEQEIPTP